MCQHFENLRIGFTGSVTFLPKSAKGVGKGQAQHEESNYQQMIKLMRGIPLERMLLETDGPYMCPAPFRGQTAHPGHVHRVAERIAEVRGISVEKVLAATRESARAVYGV
jgi:TatD DNase family protein